MNPTENLQTYWINLHGNLVKYQSAEKAAPLLRKSFYMKEKPRNARLKFSAPGWADLTINGKTVTDDIMIPVVTQFEKHIGFVEYDVTDLLVTGENIIGAILGNGWYNPATHEVWHFDKANWRNYNSLFLELYADKEKIVVSDDSWKGKDSGIVFNQLRSGEHFDARLHTKNWDLPGYDATAWDNAKIVHPPPGLMQKDTAPKCRIREELIPVDQWDLDDNTTIYDFGKNVTGFCRITASGEPGAELKLIYSELRGENNDIDQRNISGFILNGDIAQTDIYIHGTQDPYQWKPRFVYHGFRYVKVIRTGKIKLAELKACFVHTDFRRNGTWKIAHPIASELLECTRNSYIGNFTGIPTDCPHREKNGWTNDTMLACETGLWMFDSAENYEHFVRILADGQRLSGQLSGIAPNAGWGYNWGGGPLSDLALFEIPYRSWLFTGDSEYLKKFYPNMKSYLTFALGMRRHGLLDIGLSDWSHHTLDQIVDRSLVATACFYEMLNLMSRIAEQIMPEDLAFLTKLQTETKQAFLENFRNSDGTYAKDELTANACALYFHFEDSPELAAHLRDTVQQGSYHADFGILGAKIVPRVLAEHNYAADAFRLYTQTEYPGWGNWILRGATTLWERWNGNDSQTHIMFGDFPAWCFRYLAGIKILEPGFKKISLSPADIPEAGDFLFSYRTPAGCIEVGRSESGFFKKVPSGIEISAT